MKSAFSVGDLVKHSILYECYGIVINRNEFMEGSQVYIYRIKWANDEALLNLGTWEQDQNLILVAGVNNGKSI